MWSLSKARTIRYSAPCFPREAFPPEPFPQAPAPPSLPFGELTECSVSQSLGFFSSLHPTEASSVETREHRIKRPVLLLPSAACLLRTLSQFQLQAGIQLLLWTNLGPCPLFVSYGLRKSSSLPVSGSSNHLLVSLLSLNSLCLNYI